MSGEQSTQVAAALARMCAEEPGIRASLQRAGDASPLDRLIAAVRAGVEVSGLLEELHAALLRCGDALGGFGSTRRGEGFRDREFRSRESGSRPFGLGDPRPVEVAFHCARGTCSRDWQPDPAAPPSAPPICQVYGEPLRWTRLYYQGPLTQQTGWALTTCLPQGRSHLIPPTTGRPTTP